MGKEQKSMAILIIRNNHSYNIIIYSLYGQGEKVYTCWRATPITLHSAARTSIGKYTAHFICSSSSIDLCCSLDQSQNWILTPPAARGYGAEWFSSDFMQLFWTHTRGAIKMIQSESSWAAPALGARHGLLAGWTRWHESKVFDSLGPARQTWVRALICLSAHYHDRGVSLWFSLTQPDNSK